MTKIKVPKGVYIGKPRGEPAENERDHFTKCPGCGQWVDMRDLGDVFEHAGELPHRGGSKE